MNDFHKKIVLNQLSDLSILNLFSNSNEFRAKYVVFFKYKNKIFSTYSVYGLDLVTQTKTLTDSITKIRTCISEFKNTIDLVLINDTSNMNSVDIEELYKNMNSLICQQFFHPNEVFYNITTFPKIKFHQDDVTDAINHYRNISSNPIDIYESVLRDYNYDVNDFINTNKINLLNSYFVSYYDS